MAKEKKKPNNQNILRIKIMPIKTKFNLLPSDQRKDKYQ